MTNTNTKNNWDEDINTQESPDIRAKISTAEDEVFLRDLFGVTLPENAQDPTLAAKIAHRVVSVIDETRTRIDRNQLQTLLQHNIDDGLSRARLQFRTLRPNSHGPVLDAQRMKNVRAVAEAIRESVPSAVISEVLRYGLPSFIPGNLNKPDHIVSFEDITLTLSDPTNPKLPATPTKCDVEIDTRHAFWRRKFQIDNVATPPVDALRQALFEGLVTQKKTFATLGIRILRNGSGTPIPENTIIDDPSGASIDNLLGATAWGIDLTKRYEDINFAHPGPPAVSFRVNTPNLIRYNDNGNIVANLDHPFRLETALIASGGLQNFIMRDPPNAVVTAPQWAALSLEIFNRLRPSPPYNPTDPLAMSEMNLRNIQAQIGEQNYFHNALREGSDNQMGAAFASSILMKYKDIRDALSLGNETQMNTDLAQERRRKDLLSGMKAAEGTTFTPLFDWATALTVRTNAPAVIARISSGTAGRLRLGTQTYDLPGGSNAERNAAMQWVNQRVEEANKVIEESSRMANVMRIVCERIRAILPAATTNPSILGYFAWAPPPAIPVPNHTMFANGLNIVSLLDEVRAHPDLGLKTEDDHKKKIEELKATLEKIKKGDIPKGDKAQFLVIKKYLMEYQGMTDDEASRGANVIKGRSQLDTEAVEHINYISDKLHGSYEEDEVTDDTVFGRPERDAERMRNIAREAQIPLNANGYPAWGSARTYKDLMGAYFALRQMRDGTGVPWMMRLNNTAIVRRELREITRAILQNHMKAMLQDFGAGLNISDDEQNLILKDPTKPEHSDTLQQILSGAVPAEHQATVDGILSRGERRTFRYRRAAGNALFGENWGAITGNKLGVSGKNILYGNDNWSVRGAARGTKNTAVKSAKGLWATKSTTAKIAAFSMLGGPVGFAIGVGLFGKEFSKSHSSAPISAPSHH